MPSFIFFFLVSSQQREDNGTYRSPWLYEDTNTRLPRNAFISRELRVLEGLEEREPSDLACYIPVIICRDSNLRLLTHEHSGILETMLGDAQTSQLYLNQRVIATEYHCCAHA